MKLAHYELSLAVVQSFGLNYPERVQLYAHTWLGRAGNLYNMLRGRSVLYVVWKHEVHLTTAGLTADFYGRIDIALRKPKPALRRLDMGALSLLLRNAERRGKWKTLRQSFKNSHA